MSLLRYGALYLPETGGATVELVIQDATHAHSADSPSLTQHHVLVVADATHGHTAESPTLVQHHLLAADDALHGHTAGNVALVQHHILTVADALHAHTADSPTLSIPGVVTWWEWDGTTSAELALEGEWNGTTVDPLTFDEVYA